MNGVVGRRIRACAIAALLPLGAACNDDGSAPPAAAAPAPPTAEGLEPALFSHPITVDNRWFPLTPGTQMTWKGHALDGPDKLERRVVFTVTDLVKEIAGVQTVVIWELDYTDGELEEAELSFFAQDDAGDVWHLGEYPEEYEDGEIVKHPAWIAGAQGALAGIHMPADPALDTPSYAQGWGPKVGWDDRGDTYALEEHTCSEVECYDDVLVAKEFSRSEPGAFQLKYYAPGIGNVRVGWGGPNEEEHEVLVLTDLVMLDADALAAVRTEALAQEERAYESSPAAYGQTAPAAVRAA
jgi:hypothetical protein